MRRIGDLTRSGLLYEGNYAEWAKRMNAALRYKGLHTGCHLSQCTLDCLMRIDKWIQHSSQPRRSGRRPPEGLRNPGAIWSTVCNNISPALWDRLPVSATNHATGVDVCMMLLALKSRARPFRFLDLPPEIRLMVYEQAIPQQEHDMRVALGLDGGIRYEDGCWQPLLAVGRLVRDEALPVFLQRAEFKISSFDAQAEFVPHKVPETVALWARNVLRHHVHHLTRFEWTLFDQCYLSVKYTPKDGLTFSFEGPESEERGAVLKKHFDAIEAGRKAVGGKGEAIIYALIARPELWAPAAMGANEYGDWEDHE